MHALGTEREDLKTFSNSTVLLALLVFLMVFAGHFASDVVQTTDSLWALHTAVSIVRHRDANLDEYRTLIKPGDYRVEVIDGHIYSIFPIGTPMLAAPFVFVINRLASRTLGFDLYATMQSSGPIRGLELLIAAVLVAIASVLMYLTAQRLLASRSLALLTMFIFAFCTSTWSTASRALWQHGPSILMLSIVLYLIVLADSRPGVIQFLSIPLAFAYIIRPTNALSALILTGYVAIHYRRYLLRYLVLALSIALPFLLYNLTVVHAPLPWYYLPERLGGRVNFWIALAGNLVSPARGLLLYTPVLALSFFGVLLKLRHKEMRRVDPYLLTIIVLHWLAISSFPHWWGGWSFGPRLFSDMIPYLVYFAVPAIGLLRSCEGFRKMLLATAVFCLVGLSFLIHYEGATNPSTWRWNGSPIDVDSQPARLWDWHDIQFMRGLR